MKWSDVSKPEIWEVEIQKSKKVCKNRKLIVQATTSFESAFLLFMSLSRWATQGLLPASLDSACDADSGAISAHSLNKSLKFFFGVSVIFPKCTGY